jgi:hypothetical protein
MVKELEPLKGKVAPEKLEELNLFLINCCLDTAERTKLVNIFLK